MDSLDNRRIERLLQLLCGVLLFVSSGLALGSYQLFDEAIRIRWHVGTYYHVGPETVPTTVLAAVPGIVLLSCVTAWLVTTVFRTETGRSPLGVMVWLGTASIVGLVVGIQLLLIVLNVLIS